MRYAVYCEIQDDGTTMVHVPALPGCISTGVTREVALARAPELIRAYCTWLHGHGEPGPDPAEPVEIEVAGSFSDTDPHLGDEASLLPTDQTPLAPAEVAHLIRLLNHSRQDLIDQIQGLPAELLHWQPGPGGEGENWCIDDILEHIARAERVYTSRLSGNIFEMLDESRRAGLERMSRLTDTELSQITQHQGEYWTARKVFRRFLEHEREHAQHIARILERYNGAQGLTSPLTQ